MMKRSAAVALAVALGPVGAGVAMLQAQKAVKATPGVGAARAAKRAMDDPGRSDEGVTGPYDVVIGWPKPLSSWPGHEGWTWGSTQGVFAQNPDRIFITMRGELPELKATSFDTYEEIATTRPVQKVVTVDAGTKGPVSLTVPVTLGPWRNASVDPSASPGEPDVRFTGVEGKDYRWEHLLFTVDSAGNLKEAWTQWDKTFKRAHKVLINPYDPEKRVWVDDDGRNAIFVFSNDGKQLLQTIGIPNEFGSDDTRFHRQTDLSWLPDGTFFVSDGYENTRVVKFDKNGKFVKAWGEPSKGITNPGPNQFDTVHGMVIDKNRRVYANDRTNHRIQIFDENGKFLDMWDLGVYAAAYHLYYTADDHIWVSDGHGTWKMLKYDLTGRMLYSWGTWGMLPGEMWGVHQFSVDQLGNLYTAEVFNGRAQKFTPKKGADPGKLVGQPIRPGWKN